MERDIRLTEAQQSAFEAISQGVAKAGLVVFQCASGFGRTTVLRKLAAAQGGILLGTRQFMSALMSHQPAQMEEAFLELIDETLVTHDLVVLDDFHLIYSISDGFNPRGTLLNLVITALADEIRGNKRLVLGIEPDELPTCLQTRAFRCEMGKFQPSDYQQLCEIHLGTANSARLDMHKIHRFAPKLNAYQIQGACLRLGDREFLDTDAFLDFLAEQDLTSNVDIEEVQPVDWKDLKGMDELIEELETKITLPFENDGLAAELQLKPKRGVLLAGPPGTGKTTIGRALARRLKGKFFLIDGTTIAGTDDFYKSVRTVFRKAKRNAPSIIFVDDADLIFGDNDNPAFYRYLLTMMDGLESASSELVCVMMTTMDVGSLPPALLRSGRVELWLETRLPDLGARREIISDRLSRVPALLSIADLDRMAAASHGFTGADLKAAVEDAKLLLARDRSGQGNACSLDEYFLQAARKLRANRRKYVRKRGSHPAAETHFGFEMSGVGTDRLDG